MLDTTFAIPSTEARFSRRNEIWQISRNELSPLPSPRLTLSLSLSLSLLGDDPQGLPWFKSLFSDCLLVAAELLPALPFRAIKNSGDRVILDCATVRSILPRAASSLPLSPPSRSLTPFGKFGSRYRALIALPTSPRFFRRRVSLLFLLFAPVPLSSGHARSARAEPRWGVNRDSVT